MKSSRFKRRLVCGLGFAWTMFAADAAERVNFARDILPVLSDKCFACHGPDAKEGRKGDLRLDSEADVKRERDGYRVIDVSAPGTSSLLHRIESRDDDQRMPPPESGRDLLPGQRETLRRWISEGAEWGRHWGFERVVRPDVKVTVESPVDELVGRELSKAGMDKSPRADRNTLIRRVSLDLTGLPPTPEEVASFVDDLRADAWERAIDRLLASPAYGERMAWDWLDASRYADSNGYQGDRERTMWPWRDWVVRAFNDNLSYDQFTLWQLAGDLLPTAGQEQILATGFNRNHMINGEGGRIAEENRVDYVQDMTETMGTVWLALTLNCCRCHDHKFDPITQREYYQLTAFFNQTPVDGKGGNAQTPPTLEAPTEVQAAGLAKAREAAQSAVAAVRSRIAALARQQAAWETAQLAEGRGGPGWERLRATLATAKEQVLSIESNGAVLAGGEAPDHDEYIVEYGLKPGTITGFRLDARHHPSLPKSGLSRNESGNFVLTDIRFELMNDAAGSTRELPVGSAEATFEQNGLTIVKAFDGDPRSGWGVWDGAPVDREHAAVFRLAEPVLVGDGSRLRVTLKFNSPARNHVLGHFELSQAADEKPELRQASHEVLAWLKIPKAERDAKQLENLREAFHQSDASLTRLRKSQTAADARLKKLQAAVPKVMVMADLPQARKTFMLDRGLYNQPGEPVDSAVPEALRLTPVAVTNRLDLARWLVSRNHPLTARVAVNRFWQMLFGIGLVKTAEDLGVQGEYPAQRELLDWLAVEFMETGWDVKRLLKTIVLSETYRRSSAMSPKEHERDPENRLLARGARFRLPSWMIRDQALAASGLLNSDVGGEPVNSYQPAGVWSEATFGKKTYEPNKGKALYRRSLYTFWRRIIGPTLFFDSAKRQVCEVKPLRTNTPMHALTTLNDVTYVEAARALAEVVLRQAGDDTARLRLAAQRVMARTLTEPETAVWLKSLGRVRKEFSADPDAAGRFVAHGDSVPDSAQSPVTLAAWTAICLNLLNLDETLTKE